MKDDPSHQIEYGVSAQDVQKVFPELGVRQVEGDGTLGVSYNGLIRPMIEAIKMQQQQIMLQQSQIDTVRAELEALKSQQ